MPLPPVNLDGIRRSNSMPDQGHQVNLDNLGHLDNLENQEQVDAPPNQPQVAPVANDPVVNQVVGNGAGPDLQPNNGQAGQFAANHEVEAGRDWDMKSADGMLDTAQNAVRYIKKTVAAGESFDAYDAAMSDVVTREINDNQHGELLPRQALAQSLMDFKGLLIELKAARASLAAAIKDGSGAIDSRAGIAQIRKTLRVFRYEMQVELAKMDPARWSMERGEGFMRKIQHAFDFGVGSKVVESFADVMRLEALVDAKVAEMTASRKALRPEAPQLPPPPPQFKLATVAQDVLELSHRTNDQIREFEDVDATSAKLRNVAGMIAAKGGSREVAFTIGGGMLAGLGLSGAATLAARGGGRVRIIGTISSPGKGQSVSVTFRVGGGGEVKGGAVAGESFKLPGAGAQAAAGLEVTHFSTRTYATVDDFIMDARNCRFASFEGLGSIALFPVRLLAYPFRKLGKFALCKMGRRSDEVKMGNAQYLVSLKARGIAGGLDKVIASRANPVILSERKGLTTRAYGEIGGAAKIFDGILEASVNALIGGERDWKVKGHRYSYVVRTAREAQDVAALNALMHPGPAGGEAAQIPQFGDIGPQAVRKALEQRFEEAVAEAEEIAKRCYGFLNFTPVDKVGFANAANKIRTAILATELAVRQGKISRGVAERLLARYSNISVKFPPDIFREYLMTGTEAAKPATIRKHFSFGGKISLFKGFTEGLTEGIGSLVFKAAADGAIDQARGMVGLDNSIQYTYSSEKPASPGADPRPWENVKKTTHSLSLSASMPMRAILDVVFRTCARKGGRLENDADIGLGNPLDTLTGGKREISQTLALSVLSSLVVSSMKTETGAKAKVWLSDPAHLAELAAFAGNNLDKPLDLISAVLEHVVSESKPIPLEEAMKTVNPLGKLLDISVGRTNVLKWSFVDGELESLAVFHETKSSTNVNIGASAGLGVGVDTGLSFKTSVRVRSVMMRPTLLMLLARAEGILFGDTGLKPLGGEQMLKGFLAKNYAGVNYMLAHMMDEDHAAKTAEIYAKAQVAAAGDPELQSRLQEAWQAVNTLPANATHDAKVDATHRLLVEIVRAFRTA